MTQYYLTDEDRRLLNKLLEEAKIKDERRPADEEELNWAQETYVAKTTESIAGISGDAVSSGVCDIYRITTDDTLVQLHSDLWHEVYNLSTGEIASGVYVVISRDKFGKWVIGAGLGEFEEWTFVTDVQLSGMNFQKKTFTCYVYNPDGNVESGWITWHTGTEC